MAMNIQWDSERQFCRNQTLVVQSANQTGRNWMFKKLQLIELKF
jgi:hypothetical protein